ncbi:hypothetical protein [Neobacillus endophyticus]|nr:hypothetical protein [Neobacillus endophyticus]
MVVNGEIKPNVTDNSSLIHLPKKYDHLSAGGGDIVVEKTSNGYNILFFTFRGVLDGFSGFVYATTDQKPLKNAFDGDIKEINRMAKNWFFISSN